MNGWAGRLSDFFYRTDREFLALWPLASSNTYELARFTADGGCWQMAESVVVSPSSGILTETQSVAATDELADVANWAALEIARKGWQQKPLLFVIADGEIIGYALQLPPDLTAAQQREAAYWEFDDKLLARGLSAENFVCICQPLSSNRGQCTISGVRQGYLQEVEKAFLQADLTLADIIPAAGDAQQAVLSYLNSKQREAAGFKKRPGARLSAAHILTVWLGLLVMLGCLLLVVDIYHYKHNQSMAIEQRQELQRLAEEQSEMKRMLAKEAAIDSKEKLLFDIGQRQHIWYSLLVHLGVNTTEGVFLTGLYTSNDGRQLYMEGKAVNYDALAEFVGQLEEDRAIFAQGVKLARSELIKGSADELAKVSFVVAVDWESGYDGNASGEVRDDL